MAKVNLKNVRVCFLNIWERDTPKQAGQKPAYRAVILLDKEDPQVDKVEAAARAALTVKLKSEKNADKWMDRHYAQDSKECAVRDGDERDEVTEEFEGMLYINAKSFKQPNIQTSLGEKQTEQGLTVEGDEIEGQEIYSGCYCNVSLDIWAWNNTNGKGLGAGLLGLRFRDDGEAFGGGGSSCSDEDLDNDDEDERPRKSKKSKRRDDDDEDDKPRKSKKSKRRDDDEDDEDEKPRKRRKPRDDEDEDEDDEDEAPRKRRRR